MAHLIQPKLQITALNIKHCVQWVSCLLDDISVPQMWLNLKNTTLDPRKVQPEEVQI